MHSLNSSKQSCINVSNSNNDNNCIQYERNTARRAIRLLVSRPRCVSNSNARAYAAPNTPPQRPHARAHRTATTIPPHHTAPLPRRADHDARASGAIQTPSRLLARARARASTLAPIHPPHAPSSPFPTRAHAPRTSHTPPRARTPPTPPAHRATSALYEPSCARSRT